jgi:hypothetical protein
VVTPEALIFHTTICDSEQRYKENVIFRQDILVVSIAIKVKGEGVP